MARKLCLSGIVVLVLLFAYFVWPTPWAYYEQAMTRTGSHFVRRNRLTNDLQFYRDGWEDGR